MKIVGNVGHEKRKVLNNDFAPLKKSKKLLKAKRRSTYEKYEMFLNVLSQKLFLSFFHRIPIVDSTATQCHLS
jgi:hypothetical protein